MLAEQFRRTFEVVMLPNGRLSSRRALFQAILYELGRPYRGMDEGETRLAVVDYLLSDESGSRGMVLLIDEAHTLPLRLLEEIRLLTNLARGGQPLVRAVLAGGPVLEERFASPKLDSLSQRLIARCYLESLNKTETESYIHAQIDTAGGLGEQLFPSETCQNVFQATGGVPRLINQVCDHALLLGYVAGKEQISSADIEEAWGDLQQLPTPWSSESKSDPAGSGVIEFGALDDQTETTPSISATSSGLRISPIEDEFETDDAEPGRQICRIEKLLAEADDDFQPIGSIGPEVELSFEGSIHPFQEEFEREEIVADRYAGAVHAASAKISATTLPINTTEASPPKPTDAELADTELVAETTDLEDELVVACASALNEAEGDDWKSLAIPSSPPPPPKPRQDYRQLFARLRRG
jgi:type II secretory pathway predicted ATPase ExeA